MGKASASSENERASDSDRSRVVDALGAAFAEGRLSMTEHDERLSTVYAAKTLAELDELTKDLPRRIDSIPTYPETRTFLSKIWRQGQWTVGRSTRVRAILSVVMMDLSSANFLDREITIDASGFCGKVVLTVPDDARVVDTGTVLFGKRRVSATAPVSGDGPLIIIMGRTVLGKLAVVRSSEQPLR